MAVWFRYLATDKFADTKINKEVYNDFQNVLPLLKKAIYYSEGDFIRYRAQLSRSSTTIRREFQ